MFLRAVGLAVLASIFICLAVFVAAGLLPVKEPGSGLRTSTYVPTKDGTRLAVRVTLPAGWHEGERVPAVAEFTRYGTQYKRSFLLRALLNLRVAKERPSATKEAIIKAGYANVEVDQRGSGASFGHRDMEWSREDIADMRDVLDWIAEQPWCDGRIAAYGVSYSGNTAELAASTNHPHLVAALPLYSDFDPLEGGVMPGGLLNATLVTNWNAGNAAPDYNKKSLFNGGIAPVDGDSGERLLRSAIAEHRTVNIAEAFKRAAYFDDPLTGAYQAQSLAPYNYRDGIESSGSPLYIRIGWQDGGTANGAIERFLTYRNDQTVVIGPWNHTGRRFYDPLLPKAGARPTLASVEQTQAEEIVGFLDRHFKSQAKPQGQAKPKSQVTVSGKEIKYYTLGEGTWKTTNTWPMAGFESRTFYFDAAGRLSQSRPTSTSTATSASASDTYRVDFTASTGVTTRWSTNLGGGPISYPDRAEEDKKLLTYTSAPFERDTEITGTPVVTLNVSSTTDDGAFYAYLEDVAPDGKVTYITEGQLRGIHRKLATADPGRTVLGPIHSHLRKDGGPLRPGEIAELKIGLYTTSVLIRKGHRIRIALAGHDAANFARVPAQGVPVIRVHRSALRASYVELPVKAR